MASPPFNINQALPGDTDIVSQHPGNARTFRDVVESWLLINHDVNGNHARVDMPQIASPSSPAAGIDVLYVTTTKRLKIKHSDGTEEYVGVPPGAIIYGSGSLDAGYLEADGSAVSRATFADLFAKISTNYGVGDGSTTFNLPEIKGRVIAGIDAAGVRLSAAGLGTAAILGAVGGFQTHTLTTAQLAAHTHGVTDPGHTHNFGGGIPIAIAGASLNTGGTPNSQFITATQSNTTGITINSSGSDSAHNNTQPTIVQRAMIKY